MKVSSSWLKVCSTSWSILSRKYASLRKVLFKSLKLTHILHFPLFLFTTTVFAIHVWNWISYIKLASTNLISSFLIARAFLSPMGHRFSAIGLMLGSIFNPWVMISLLIPNISLGFQVKSPLNSKRKSIRASNRSSGSVTPICTTLSSPSTWTFFKDLKVIGKLFSSHGSSSIWIYVSSFPFFFSAWRRP